MKSTEPCCRQPANLHLLPLGLKLGVTCGKMHELGIINILLLPDSDPLLFLCLRVLLGLPLQTVQHDLQVGRHVLVPDPLGVEQPLSKLLRHGLSVRDFLVIAVDEIGHQVVEGMAVVATSGGVIVVLPDAPLWCIGISNAFIMVLGG